jgi:hypothetical protein
MSAETLIAQYTYGNDAFHGFGRLAITGGRTVEIDGVTRHKLLVGGAVLCEPALDIFSRDGFDLVEVICEIKLRAMRKPSYPFSNIVDAVLSLGEQEFAKRHFLKSPRTIETAGRMAITGGREVEHDGQKMHKLLIGGLLICKAEDDIFDSRNWSVVGSEITINPRKRVTCFCKGDLEMAVTNLDCVRMEDLAMGEVVSYDDLEDDV